MEIQQGRAPTDADMLDLNWRLENISSNIGLCNDILKQLVTLSSALLGAASIFDNMVTPNYINVGVMFSFFASLIIAFLGLLPFEQVISSNTPENIEIYKQKALRHKRRYLWVSAFVLVIGFGFIMGELTLNMFTK